MAAGPRRPPPASAAEASGPGLGAWDGPKGSRAFRTQLQEAADAAIGVLPRATGKMVDPPVQDLPVYGMR